MCAENRGRLYICGTPIGNLDDITFRALDTLKKVKLIAAEDTRRTSKLLNYYQIETPLTSYHEHNEREKAGELLERLQRGEDLALVSDAGMPGISDPGLQIIEKAVAAGIELIPIPGPTAAVSALVVSGLSMERFVFEGFLPRRGKEREQRLQVIQREEGTSIIYESPNRVMDTLKELAPLLGRRRVAVVRELTKVHEEKIYGEAEEILERLQARELKGEVVIVIEGNKKVGEELEGWEDLTIEEHILLLMENGYPKKEAVKEVARTRELPKSQVYKEGIKIPAKK